MVTKLRAHQWGIKKTNKILKIDFVRFCIVGAVGFSVTAFFDYLFKRTLNRNIDFKTIKVKK